MSEDMIQRFLEFYDHKVPDPEHCPRQFAYYVKLFYYCINKQSK